jgi:hypothetical protein
LIDAVGLSPDVNGALSKYSQGVAIIALRLMIAWKFDFEDNLFGLTDPSDKEFFRVYLTYLAQLRHDDLSHWSDE